MTKDKSNRIAIIGLILTSIGILAPILYSKFQDKSIIQIQQNNLTTILNKPVNIDSLQIYYKKTPIDNLSKLNLSISNNSKISVVQKDFIKPINIKFSDNTKIISYEIEKTQPIGVSATVEVDSMQNSLNLSFDLLNPNDKVDIGIIFTGELKEPSITGRIKGIKKIEYNIQIDSRKKYIIPLIVLIFVTLALKFFFIVNRELNSSIFSKNRFLKSKDDIKIKYFNDVNLLVHSFFSHYSFNSISEIVQKIKLINDNDEIKDKSLAIDNTILNELNENISLNTKARIVGGIIILIGIIYLVIWGMTNELLKNGIQQWL